MPGYTSEEVQASVNRFLLGAVSTLRTSLGSRDVLTARDDIYALLTTTLLLKPDSYFYVIWLAKNRLEALRRKQAEALDFILDSSTVAALGRRGKPVTSTVELTNASAALLNLNAGLNQGEGVQTRELGPEVTRFRNSIERFIRGQLQDNVVESGVPTETAGEIRDRITSSWADVKARHTEMLELSASIRDAISNLNSVKLPEKAVREVVTRLRERLDELTVELADDKTLSTHRESMLELLTMRTLLAKVSTFRTPQRLLAPVTGDGTLLTGAGGTTPASIVGTISGPFNVPPSSTLDFESGSPVVPSSVPIGDYSNAETRSRQILSFPFTLPASAALQLRVNGTLYPDDPTFGGAAYANLAAFVAAIQAYITTNAVPATVFSSALRAVIRSTDPDDTSNIEVIAGTTAQQNFLVTTGFDRYGVCRPVSAASIIEDATPHVGVRLSELSTEYFTGTGTTLGGGILDFSKASGVMNIAGGTMLTASVNLENAGVRPGDWFWTSTEVRLITSVLGAIFEVDEPMPNLGPGITYRVGVDLRDVPAGARVLVGSSAVPLNSGPYRVSSGDIARLTVDRSFFTNADPVSVTVSTSFLVAAAMGSEPADGITAWPASAGATAVGFTPSATQVRGDFTELDAVGAADFLARGVGSGDTLTLLTPSPVTTLITSATVDALGVQPTPYFAGNVEYRIESTRYLSWLGLVDDIETFLDSVDFEAADFAITRILSGAAPSTLLSGGGPVGQFATIIDNLVAIQDYVVPFERSVDNIIKMLSEQGMDRALDLFTTLQVVEFFSMHPDGVSYSTHLLRTAHTVTMQVAPVSRAAKSIINSPEVRLRSRRMQSG